MLYSNRLFVTVGTLLFVLSRRRANRRHLAESTIDGLARSEGTSGEKRMSPRVRNEGDYVGPTAKAGPYNVTETAISGTPFETPNRVSRVYRCHLRDLAILLRRWRLESRYLL